MWPNSTARGVVLQRVIALVIVLLPMVPWVRYHPADLGLKALVAFWQLTAGVTLCAIGVWGDGRSVWFRRSQWFAAGWIWFGVLAWGWSFRGFYITSQALLVALIPLVAAFVQRRFAVQLVGWAVLAGAVQWLVLVPFVPASCYCEHRAWPAVIELLMSV
jgi:hypothetical protein